MSSGGTTRRVYRKLGRRVRLRLSQWVAARNILTVWLPEGEARARFAAVPVVRLGTADGQGRPHVVVTFAVEGGMVYTAVDQKPKSGRPLKRLRNVGENPAVTMLADRYSEDWETLWWVRADGRAAILAVTVEGWTGWSGARAN